MEKKWKFPLMASILLCLFLLVTTFNMSHFSSIHTINKITSIFASQTITISINHVFSSPPTPTNNSTIPCLAYLVSGSKGELDQLWRTLRALYHPRNQYIVHLDLESPAEERLKLASNVADDPIFAKVGNVHVISKANMVTYRGPSMVANTLHACAILLKKSKEWDWFINLSASDYPLVTQDDMLYTFSSLPRNLNFVEHTSNLEWKEAERGKPLIIDPGLYSSKKSDIFWVNPRRELPTAFKLFTGSAWMVLSREFTEFCIWGWDNLPRTLLMYYTNFVSSPEGYFQTVICNTPEFISTIVNHDLHYIAWDVPPKQHPHNLSADDGPKMINANVPFARKFKHKDALLDRIDAELLGWSNEGFVPGGWCSGGPPCSEVGDPSLLKPGPGAERLRKLMNKIVRSKAFKKNQCK
ncbi:hypothetical protein J5N97_012883 [Dioscorea zingiberensis]|uniref:Uncharacterized protein n=1 Tax=Dioscorea zingiberensis TaxID=325984 RepID=A0A9D5CQV5_9LILI|nr:hypothetical protein J5N97_012883 [Dioscorea zingiberensis]